MNTNESYNRRTFIKTTTAGALLASTAPLALALACAVWAALAGTYRGLRLSELLRFGAEPAAPVVPTTVPLPRPTTNTQELSVR